MKEDFLHYIWKFQKFETQKLRSVCGQSISIVEVGQHNFDSGPDFFNAKLIIDGQLWAGNIEIHVEASQWYSHNHDIDVAYDTVILHLVWEHDTDVFRSDSSKIPVLALKERVATHTLRSYRNLFESTKDWINCEGSFDKVPSFVVENWLERLYLERLEQKMNEILQALTASKNHWEALMFRLLCKNFGLKVNGAQFYGMAQWLPFSIVQKCRNNVLDLEALLFGVSGLLSKPQEDAYFKELLKRYRYLCTKFNLRPPLILPPKFFRLRPANFPTIRLSQLAVLYSSKQHIFATSNAMKSIDAYYDFFTVAASTYWDTHYNFGTTSKQRKKRVTKKFIDLLLINTLLPIRFCYAKQRNTDVSEEIVALATTIAAEHNTIVKKFNALQPVAENALQSQGLIQLKNEYCNQLRCLHCAIGNSVLQSADHDIRFR
ncbi:DUF2851 family protein [Candidatus Ulvibacter alkanivorans]|uniref:DUF2851 family protein n=1 Tax=Candidatus Ulvibacter alkanivorans TaxID=2267620 RepID=UPI000DF18344|nr:DUF2851 family protein [Candidatus Ulvibacter alkanivorans]